MRRLHCLFVIIIPAVAQAAFGGEARSLRMAYESIRSRDLKRHVEALAADALEGREAGSRGGQAAGGYLVNELRRLGLSAAGTDGGYYQSVPSGGRNVLALVKGSDPQLADQVIVVGAHYDHVGYGRRGNSFGPYGLIHNGADDNASGTSALLELAEALTALPTAPKRSILLAWWDGEEQGLLGSKHWLSQPTIARERVVAKFNLDMVGRLRNDQLEVLGTRTSFGWRQLVSRQNSETSLALDFKWENKGNSDHYPFYSANVPFLMFHTGDHEDYHRPSDDAEKVNVDGMERIGRLLFNVVLALAEQPQLPGFREASRREMDESARRRFEQPAPPPPGRLGVSWAHRESVDGRIVISEIVPGSAAAIGGLMAGDRILLVGNRAVTSDESFLAALYRAHGPVPIVVERRPDAEPERVLVALGEPMPRVGISWREDDAEPGSVAVVQVLAGSPAARAGLQVLDRIYRVGGQGFSTGEEFLRLCRRGAALEVEYERTGRIGVARLMDLAPVPDY